MKFRYFFIIILAIGLTLQFNRMINKEQYFSIEQEVSFEKAPAKNSKHNFTDTQKTLVYYSKNSEISRGILDNVREAFKFAKVDYDVRDIEEVASLKDYDVYIFATDTFIGFQREMFDGIIKELNEGKKVVFLNRTPYNPFNKIAGITNFSEKIYEKSRGLKFSEKLYPGIDAYEPSEAMVEHTVMEEVSLASDVKIFARSRENTPILWERKVGNGVLLYSNVGFFENKIMRGLMHQWIAYAYDWNIAPTLNGKLLHIDDFPSPIPRVDKKVVRDVYDISTREFYIDVWWKDMELYAEKYGLVYSGFIIIDYNNIVESEKMKRISDMNLKDLSHQGRELFLHKGELGIHGYNHNPIVFEKDKDIVDFKGLSYVPWRSEADVAAGANEVKNYVKEIFGKKVKLYTYVAPSNIGTDEGMGMLIKNYPDLKTISTVFYGNADEGSYVQEVGRNPKYPTIYNIPRFSSGFYYDRDEMWGIFNALALYGYSSHFVHPDDVISEDRGKNKNWKQLRVEFDRVIKEIKDNFPLLQPMTSSALTQKYINIEDLHIKSERKGNEIHIGSFNFRNPYEAVIRVRGKKINKMSSGTFKEMYTTANSKVYLVNIDKEDVTLYLGD